VKGNTLGLAKLMKQVTLQPNTQQIVRLKCPKINEQSVFLLEPIVHEDTQGFCLPRTILANTGWHYCQLWNPTDESIVLHAGTFIGQLTPLQDIVSIAQENAPAAANIDVPCYVTGVGQGDYPRPICYRNKHRRYSAYRIRASPTNFSSSKNNDRMQNSYSRNESFAQNDRRENVENHHHQNHSDSLTFEPLIKHTYDELKISLTNRAITPEQQLKFSALIDEFGGIFAVNNSILQEQIG